MHKPIGDMLPIFLIIRMWAFGLLEKLDKCWTTLGFQVAYMGQPNSSFLRWARAIIPQDSVEFNH